MKLKVILLVGFISSSLSYGQGIFSSDNPPSVRIGFTQAVVPFGISSTKPAAIFDNNDFTFYTDDEYGFGVEFQLLSGDVFGLQTGGFYYYAYEWSEFDDGTVDAINEMTLEGGGIYGGLTFRYGSRYVGVTSAINLGYFTFDYRMKLSHQTMFMTGFVTAYESEVISGLGSRVDFGLYGEFGRFGLYPSFQLLYVAKEGPSALILKTLNFSLGYKF